jgi:formylmethanofuran dehydrogenase subunit B
MQNQQVQSGITCPACGLLCDDISVNQSEAQRHVEAKGCQKAIAFFSQAITTVTPTIQGKACTLDEAIAACAKLLKHSQQPLFAGLGTDVNGIRALLSLAEKTGAYLDHMHSESALRNIKVLQQQGWQSTTLTEVKQRADVLLVVGSDIVSHHPRFFDRILWQGEALFAEQLPAREIIFIGPQSLNISAATSPAGKSAQHLVCALEDCAEVMASLNGLLHGQTLQVNTVAGIPVQQLLDVAKTLQAAKYSVMTWVAKDLDFAHADLCVQSIVQCVATLNQSTRSSVLPLGGSDGDYSVYQASTWTTGYPVRLRYHSGAYQYDPYHFSSEQLSHECDSLLWISTLNPHPAPTAIAKRIVIGHPALAQYNAEVFIPVAIPGLHHSGTLFRVDSSVSLPLHQVCETNLPRLAQVIQQIEEAYRAD